MRDSNDETIAPSTIYDIAAKAGVSKSTVARVLRGELKENSRTSTERADKIRQLASDLNYKPNWRAKTFSTQRTHSIGLLYASSAVVFRGVMAEVAEGFDRRLRHHGYHLLMLPIGADDQSWRDIVFGGGIDGVAMLFHYPDKVASTLTESRIPAVLLGERCNCEPVLEVSVDDYTGSYTATRHLIELGHRDIIFYFFEYDRDHYSVAERRAGFEAALAEAGIDPAGRFWSHVKAEDAAPLLAAKRLPTAVVCYSHYESFAVTHGLWSKGVRVPEDVSVVGFNDLTAMRYMTPPLTTVGFDTREIGRVGADLLIKRIESVEELEPQKITLKEQLIVRGSTGRPRADEVVIKSR